MLVLTAPILPSYISFATFVLLDFISFCTAITITSGLVPEPTHRAELVKREIDTWGYISGDSNSPLTCPQSYTRTYDGIGDNILACCNDVVCHNDWHLCVPYGGTGCPFPSICSEIYTSYTSCGQALPGCMTYVLPTVSEVGATDGITSYDCGPSETVIHVLTTVTGGQAAATSNPAGSFPSETGQASTSTQSTPNSGSSNSGSDTSGSSSSSGHLSTGAYVGIAIGGIVGLVILGLILWGCFACIRKYCFRKPRPGGGSSYAATNYEMGRVAEWQESQSH